ncbi:MAG: hypothetical protein AAGH89_09145 [Verrucomicrobiota bacterium]
MIVTISLWNRTQERMNSRKRLDEATEWARRHYSQSDERRQAMDLVYAINDALPWIAIASLEPSSRLVEDLKLAEWDRAAVRFRYLKVANRTVEVARWMSCERIEDLVRYLCNQE